jgi:hypothetical protein
LVSSAAIAVAAPSLRSRARRLLVLLALCLAPAGHSQELARPGEAEVEAAYLVNFLRYTQWPDGSFVGAQAPYVITVVGSETVANRVRAVARAAARVDGRGIEVHSLANPRGSLASPYASAQDREALGQLRRSHLVFFHESAGAPSPKVLGDLWGQPVLTVSDSPGFTAAGGMLGLFRSSGRVAFEANPVAIRNARLVLSAKVLKLARDNRMQSR